MYNFIINILPFLKGFFHIGGVSGKNKSKNMRLKASNDNRYSKKKNKAKK